MRPANIITAWADILCGFATTTAINVLTTDGRLVADITDAWKVGLLVLATSGLYGGGVVFNDVFDEALDKIERPERPIPSGRATVRGAVTLGLILILIGLVAAFAVSTESALIAILIAIAALVYDKWGKHDPVTGPLNMGMCRGLNLILGMSAAIEAVNHNWFLAFIPVIFISAITMISRSEVRGGDRNVLIAGGSLFLIVIAFICAVQFVLGNKIFDSIPFLLLFSFMVFKPLFKAIREPSPKNIKMAVRGGIIGLIPMNAAIASGYSGWFYGLMIILLLPLSVFLAKKFAVT